MSTKRKSVSELTLSETLIYRALCNELESISEALHEEASCHKPDFHSIAAAMRDRRLAVEWLRSLGLPPASIYCSGPSEEDESRLLQEAGA